MTCKSRNNRVERLIDYIIYTQIFIRHIEDSLFIYGFIYYFYISMIHFIYVLYIKFQFIYVYSTLLLSNFYLCNHTRRFITSTVSIIYVLLFFIIYNFYLDTI